MKLTQPNCRVQFTAEDIEFIVRAIGGTAPRNQSCLVELLVAEDTRDQILDDEHLYRSLLENRNCLPVSDHFYFFVIVRHVLREAGIEDRGVADYVAELLCEFSRQERQALAGSAGEAPVNYFFEAIDRLRRADERTRFLLHAHLGDCALFLAGVFCERIRYRAETRGFPDLRYYEDVGRSNYRAAGGSRLAGRHALGEILTTLATRFQETRQALNEVADRLFALGDDSSAVDRLLLKVSTDRLE